MSTFIVEFPEPLKQDIEAVAAKQGVTVSQFLAKAAGEKLASMASFEALRSEAQTGRRDAFDKYLAAVPDVAPAEDDRLDG